MNIQTIKPVKNMKNYRYVLKSMPKFVCPECDKKSLVKYFDTLENDFLSDEYGKCDRLNNCGYSNIIGKNNLPDSSFDKDTYIAKKAIKKPYIKPKHIPIPRVEYENICLSDYDENGFLLALIGFNYPIESIKELLTYYSIGSYGSFCAFPFVDYFGNITGVQLKKFDDKAKTEKTTFLHSVLSKKYDYEVSKLPLWLCEYLNNDTKVACFFGENLLRKYPKNPVCVVESPKNAIIATLEFGFPKNESDFIFLASYNLTALNKEKCKWLIDRNVTILSDFDAYDNWAKRAQSIDTNFEVSNFLVNFVGSDKEKESYDIADFFLCHAENRNSYKGKFEVLRNDFKEVSIQSVPTQKEVSIQPIPTQKEVSIQSVPTQKELIKETAKERLQAIETIENELFESIDSPCFDDLYNTCYKYYDTHPLIQFDDKLVIKPISWSEVSTGCWNAKMIELKRLFSLAKIHSVKLIDTIKTDIETIQKLLTNKQFDDCIGLYIKLYDLLAYYCK